MKNLNIFEKAKCINGVITTRFPYKSGTVNLDKGLMFKEIDENTILVIENYDDISSIGVYYIYVLDGFDEVVGEDENCLFKSFNDEENLNTNNQYTVKLSIADKTYENIITSKLFPFYSDMSIIREDTGTILDDLSDITVSKCIYRNSREVLRFFKADGLNSDQELENSIIENFELIPYEVNQYVRYKTDLDLLNSVYLTLVKNYGRTKKEISSLNIEYENKLPEIDDMLKYFKDKVDDLEDDILNLIETTNISVSFVKASKKATYPITKRNSF